MPTDDETAEGDHPSAEEMRGWLKREIADIAKAMALRVEEATRCVEAYAGGEITGEESAARTYEYTCRWGEPLPGVFRSEGMTDEQILARINETRIKQGHLDKHVLARRNGYPPNR